MKVLANDFLVVLEQNEADFWIGRFFLNFHKLFVVFDFLCFRMQAHFSKRFFLNLFQCFLLAQSALPFSDIKLSLISFARVLEYLLYLVIYVFMYLCIHVFRTDTFIKHTQTLFKQKRRARDTLRLKTPGDRKIKQKLFCHLVFTQFLCSFTDSFPFSKNIPTFRHIFSHPPLVLLLPANKQQKRRFYAEQTCKTNPSFSTTQISIFLLQSHTVCYVET